MLISDTLQSIVARQVVCCGCDKEMVAGRGPAVEAECVLCSDKRQRAEARERWQKAREVERKAGSGELAHPVDGGDPFAGFQEEQ